MQKVWCTSTVVMMLSFDVRDVKKKYDDINKKFWLNNRGIIHVKFTDKRKYNILQRQSFYGLKFSLQIPPM